VRISIVETGQINVASMREIVRRNVRFLDINTWDIVLHWNEATRNERTELLHQKLAMRQDSVERDESLDLSGIVYK
jgi:hypothetical protein